MSTLTRCLLLAAVVAMGASCFGGAGRHYRHMPPTDRTLWEACQQTLARICRSTFEPTWDTCLAHKRDTYITQPSFEARRAYLLSERCPPRIVNGAVKRSRDAVTPKAVGGEGAAPGKAAPTAPKAPAPPTTAPKPATETPS